MNEVSDTSYRRGQRAVYSVLDREFVAHRSLWIGALLFALLASFAYPIVTDSPDFPGTFLKALATAALLFSLFFLWTLNLLFKSFATYVEKLEPSDKPKFLAGLYRGLFVPLVSCVVLLGGSLYILLR